LQGRVETIQSQLESLSEQPGGKKK
jgi:hypothetical protein